MVLLAATTAASAVSAVPEAITVDLDLTFVIQVILFVGLTLVLKPVLFDPMLKLFEERERRIDGAKLQARHIDEQSVTALSKYETEMAKARAVANSEREKLRAEAAKRENEILSQVRQTTTRLIEDGKRRTQEEAQRARAGLRASVSGLAGDLATKALGREVKG
jgi:F-type H+-transporting ATPase subunit b